MNFVGNALNPSIKLPSENIFLDRNKIVRANNSIMNTRKLNGSFINLSEFAFSDQDTIPMKGIKIDNDKLTKQDTTSLTVEDPKLNVNPFNCKREQSIKSNPIQREIPNKNTIIENNLKEIILNEAKFSLFSKVFKDLNMLSWLRIYRKFFLVNTKQPSLEDLYSTLSSKHCYNQDGNPIICQVVDITNIDSILVLNCFDFKRNEFTAVVLNTQEDSTVLNHISTKTVIVIKSSLRLGHMQILIEDHKKSLLIY